MQRSRGFEGNVEGNKGFCRYPEAGTITRRSAIGDFFQVFGQRGQQAIILVEEYFSLVICEKPVEFCFGSHDPFKSSESFQVGPADVGNESESRPGDPA